MFFWNFWIVQQCDLSIKPLAIVKKQFEQIFIWLGPGFDVGRPSSLFVSDNWRTFSSSLFATVQRLHEQAPTDRNLTFLLGSQDSKTGIVKSTSLPFLTRQCYNLYKFHLENLDVLICNHQTKIITVCISKSDKI